MQLKENLKAKQIRGYVPRDIYAEEEARLKKLEEEFAKKQALLEDKDIQQIKKGPEPSRNKRRRIDEDSDEEATISFKDGKLSIPLDLSSAPKENPKESHRAKQSRGDNGARDRRDDSPPGKLYFSKPLFM